MKFKYCKLQIFLNSVANRKSIISVTHSRIFIHLNITFRSHSTLRMYIGYEGITSTESKEFQLDGGGHAGALVLGMFHL